MEKLVEKQKNPKIDFLSVKNILHKTISKTNLEQKDCIISFEKEQFSCKIPFKNIDKLPIVDFLTICKSYIENWYIHSCAKNFICLQALNSNIFSTDGILYNIKVKLYFSSNEKILEISKKNDLSKNDLFFIMNLIQKIENINTKKYSLEMLSDLGCKVYLYDNKKKFSLDYFRGYKNVKSNIIQTIIHPIQHQSFYKAMAQKTRDYANSEFSRTVLFVGPPGVGKTLMAKLVAHELCIPLVHIALENIISHYYGESSKRLAKIFEIASKINVGMVMFFIDEIDSVAPSRDDGMFEATRRVLSVFLQEIEGLRNTSNHFIIGATNRKKDVDSALLSRFCSIIEFPKPNLKDRKEIIQFYAKHLENEELYTLAGKLEGVTPRNIRDICQKAEYIKAYELINKNTKEVTPPSLTDYLKASSYIYSLV